MRDASTAGPDQGPAGGRGSERVARADLQHGRQAQFAQLEPVLKAFAENVFHVGGPGAGHTIKLLNNFIAQAICTATAEAFAVGQRAGVNVQALVDLGLATVDSDSIQVTPLGWYFVRGVAMLFDKHLQADRTRERFSRII